MEAEAAAKLCEFKENYDSCFIFQCIVNMASAGEEEGWSCRQSMLQVGISRDLGQYRARKRMDYSLSFLMDHINIITIVLLLPRDTLKGDFQNFSS